MTIVLRLQGLHVKAGAEDIRKFFDGLHVPEGGVCIVGGSLREAFIAFTTERDGQLAMRLSGSLLKGTRVTLHISSMAEVEHKIKSKLKHKKLAKLRRPVRKPQPRPPAESPPTDPRTVAAEAAVLFETPDCVKSYKTSLALADDFPSPKEAAMVKPGYVRLFGLPTLVTKEDICHFFKGLLVQEVIMNIKVGLKRVCLVKFANYQDGCDALLLNGQQLGSTCVEVRGATEKMWNSAVQECEELSTGFDEMNGTVLPSVTQNMEKSRPAHELMNPKGSPVRKRREKSPPAVQAAMVKPGYVRLFDLPTLVTKGDICHFFKGLLVQEVIMNIKVGLKRVCLVKFANFQDGCDALLLNGQQLGSTCVEVRKATEEMWNNAVQECEDLSTEFDEMNGTVLPSVTQNMEKSRPAHELMNPKGSPVRKRREKSPPAVQATMVRPGYVRLFDLPTLVTKGDICHFFKGLLVQEVIMNIKVGLKSVCLVKFANFQDGCDALLLNGQQLGSTCVEVRKATEEMWNNAVQECEDLSTESDEMDGTVLPSMTQKMPKPRPAHELKNSKGSPVRKHREKSPPAVQAKWRSRNSCLKLQEKPRYGNTSTSGLSPDAKYYVMVTNLPKYFTKTEIKELVGCQKTPCKVIHLLDKEGQRTETAFAIFDEMEDYDYALNLNGCFISSQAICVTSVTKEKMNEMLEVSHTSYLEFLNSRQIKRKKPNTK